MATSGNDGNHGLSCTFLMGCCVGTLLSSYLGLPFGAHFKSRVCTW